MGITENSELAGHDFLKTRKNKTRLLVVGSLKTTIKVHKNQIRYFIAQYFLRSYSASCAINIYDKIGESLTNVVVT